MTEINKEQLAVWANGYRCDSDMAIKTMAKMLLDFMDRAEKEPVTWPDMPFSFEELEQMHGATFANGYVRGWARKCESVTMKGSLYTTPQPAHTEQDGWIKCSERMPEIEEDYYQTFSSAGVDVSYFFEGYFADQNITHWMPLPASPKPEIE